MGGFQYFGAAVAFHTERDTAGGVDFPLAAGIGRAALAAAVRLAGFPGRSPDFNGDGVVDLSDYFLFAGRYGTRQGETGFGAGFDLDRDGTVGIEDFFLFAEVFGRRL